VQGREPTDLPVLLNPKEDGHGNSIRSAVTRREKKCWKERLGMQESSSIKGGWTIGIPKVGLHLSQVALICAV
jgi:hypothetical protein